MTDWYKQREQGAGTVRLEVLWIVYKIFGVRILKFVVWFISLFIWMFARDARTASKKFRARLNKYEKSHKMQASKFSSFAHIRQFAYSLVDKMVAFCDTGKKINISIDKNSDWAKFKSLIDHKHGAFLICSHLGNIDALNAIPNRGKMIMHAFMRTGQNAIFRRFLDRHNINLNTVFHLTDDIDISVAGEIYDAITRGELAMMAGDRVSANNPGRNISVEFLGKKSKLPIGVFKFAHSMECPVFAIFLLNTTHENYTLYIRQIDAKDTQTMVHEYISMLQELTLKYPRQWFNFYDF